MKIHKIGIIAALAAAVLAFSPGLSAQEKDAKRQRPPGQRGDMIKERLTRMAEELKLTDAQKPKVEAALKEQIEKMRGLRDAAPEERRTKVQALRVDLDKKMKEILTAEQYEKWQKTREQGRGPREGRPGGPRGEKKRGEKKAE
jgi:Spy/CpxP family protein refolding chaperone